MAIHKNPPIWLLIIFCFLIVCCGIHLNLTNEDWLKVFQKTGTGLGQNGSFIYAATGTGIFALQFNGETGAFSLLGGVPYDQTSIFTAIGGSPDGRILLAGYTSGSKDIYAYAVNPDGTLVAHVSNSSLGIGLSLNSIAFDPLGRFVAVCMSGPIFNIYKLDYPTRKLTTVPSGQINYANDLLTSSFSPNGLYVYTGIASQPNIGVVPVDQGTGSLLTPTYTNNNNCNGANQIIFHPSGTVVYVGAKSVPAKINRYTVSSTDGTFGFKEECLLGTPGYYIGAMAIERTGRYLFAAAYGDSGILSSFPINADGSIIQGSVNTISAISYVRKLVVDPNGRYLYMAASYDGAQDYLKVYQINADASLLELSTFDFGTSCNDVVSLSGV